MKFQVIIKRIIAFMLTMVVAIASLSMVACASKEKEENKEPQKQPEPPVHTHCFATSFVEPTLTEQGYIVHVCACGETTYEKYTGISGEKAETKPEYKVLFVGNSYTYYNNLWNVFKNIAIGQGYAVTVESVTNGGWTLQQMANPADTYGKQVDTKLTNNTYDVVFLQEQSTRPALQTQLFLDAVDNLTTKIETNGAVGVLYQTWGRKTGSADLTKNNWTNETMAIALAESYETASKNSGMLLSPVGAAFLDVYTNHPEIELYNADKTHPSAVGSYLAGLCHYATVYGVSPIGVTNKYGTTSQEYVDILQQAAHKAVFGNSIVTNERQTLSQVHEKTPIQVAE